MTTSEMAPSGDGARGVTPGEPARPPSANARALPPRPSLANKTAAPVIVKLPAPFAVRVSQFFWILSLIAGSAAVVYLFVIRETQLPDIVSLIKGVDESRADETYTLAADIVYWTAFGLLVAIVALHIVFQVSFASRRPNVRWWMFGSLVVLAGVYVVARELIAMGDRGLPLERLLQAQLACAIVGLLFSVLPPALRWTARRHDVRPGGAIAPPSGDL